jgi:ABC-type multidrug transport system ATPase subunit
MTPALAIHALAKRYRAGVAGCSASVEVLRDVDLVVEPAELVEIAGGRAAGKSTLLLCAAGLRRPDAGRIAWFGVETTEEPRRSALYAAADSVPRSPATVRELASQWTRRTRDAGRQRRRSVDAALSRTGLAEAACVPVADLTRGARWRLLIAGALLDRRRLLLLDEPLAGLDVAERGALTRCLRAVVGNAGVTVLLASCLKDAGAVGGRITVLERGSLVPMAPSAGGTADSEPGVRRRVRVAEAGAVSERADVQFR